MTDTVTKLVSLPATDTATLVTVLLNHIGSKNGIRGRDLARELKIDERRLRRLIDAAINQGIGIVGSPATGYFIAATAEDVAENIEFHRSRARHELRKAWRLRKLVLPDFHQLHIPT